MLVERNVEVEPLAVELLRPPAWMQRAACRDHHEPELWFPRRGRPDDAEAAKVICAACPVRSACLDFALVWQIGDGIFGGQTVAERRRRSP